MKIIGFEEHWVLPAIAEANPNSPRKLFDTMRSGRFEDSDADGGWPTGILDLGEHRIAAMDAAGIDVQILSNVPGAEAVEVPLAVQLARQANDAVAAAVTQHPSRLRGFATLPMGDPETAAAELDRAVRDDGFVGALINGHVNGRYLDDKFFWPVFESAETLGVPIYLHPTVPPLPVIDACGADFGTLYEAVPFESPARRHRDDTAWIFYTSGTTGRPKGVMQTNGNILAVLDNQPLAGAAGATIDSVAFFAFQTTGSGTSGGDRITTGCRLSRTR